MIEIQNEKDKVKQLVCSCIGEAFNELFNYSKEVRKYGIVPQLIQESAEVGCLLPPLNEKNIGIFIKWPLFDKPFTSETEEYTKLTEMLDFITYNNQKDIICCDYPTQAKHGFALYNTKKHITMIKTLKTKEINNPKNDTDHIRDFYKFRVKKLQEISNYRLTLTNTINKMNNVVEPLKIPTNNKKKYLDFYAIIK